MVASHLIPKASPIWSKNMAVEVDRMTIAEGRYSGFDLMNQAGAAVAETLLSQYGPDRPYIIMAGPGNNGGDAIRAARCLMAANKPPKLHIFTCGTQVQRSSDCQRQLEALQEEGGKPYPYSSGQIKALSLRCPVIIDGLIGIGLTNSLRPGQISSALSECEELEGGSIVAIDIPSGMIADQFDIKAVPLAADMTLTFGGLKPCHILSPAAKFCGKVIALDIGFSQDAIEHCLRGKETILWQAANESILANNPFAALDEDAHKYDRGHVLVIGGSPGKCGAPVLSALGALRSGAGWLSLATPLGYQKPEGAPLELTLEAFFLNGELNIEALAQFVEERRVSGLVIGPGTMTSPLTGQTWGELAALQHRLGFFLVIDAGALHGLFDLPEDLTFLKNRTTITPHPGEWLKLGGTARLNGIEDLGEMLPQLKSRNITVIYKTATPIIMPYSEQYPCLAIPEPNIAIAKAGMGDVLSGIIAAHGAVGLDAGPALARAHLSVITAAKKVMTEKGANGVMPSDLVVELGQF